MKINSASIYGTTASPVRTPTWGRVTTRAEGGKTTLYLNVFDWPEDGKIFLPLISTVEACHLLVDESRRFETTTDERGTTVMLTGSASDPISSPVILKIDGAPIVSEADKILQQEDGTVLLPAQKSIINNLNGSHTAYDAGQMSIVNWEHVKASVDWDFKINTPGKYRVTLLAACEKDSRIRISAVSYTHLTLPTIYSV